MCQLRSRRVFPRGPTNQRTGHASNAPAAVDVCAAEAYDTAMQLPGNRSSGGRPPRSEFGKPGGKGRFRSSAPRFRISGLSSLLPLTTLKDQTYGPSSPFQVSTSSAPPIVLLLLPPTLGSCQTTPACLLCACLSPRLRVSSRSRSACRVNSPVAGRAAPAPGSRGPRTPGPALCPAPHGCAPACPGRKDSATFPTGQGLSPPRLRDGGARSGAGHLPPGPPLGREEAKDTNSHSSCLQRCASVPGALP